MSVSAWESWDRVIRDPESTPLEVLREVGTYQRYLAAVEEAAVKAARAGGATWEEIGQALDITRQSAWQRFRLGVRARRAVETSEPFIADPPLRGAVQAETNTADGALDLDTLLRRSPPSPSQQ